MDTLTILTTIVALYGGALSTILAIHEIRKGRPRVKISATHGFIYNQLGKPSEPVILMEAVNVGSGLIPLNGVGWLNKDGSKQHLTNPYPPGILPVDLDERKKCTSAYACRWFREKVDHDKVIGLYFQDQAGKKWIGKVTEEHKRLWIESRSDGWTLD